jgi:hypothetical protein
MLGIVPQLTSSLLSNGPFHPQRLPRQDGPKAPCRCKCQSLQFREAQFQQLVSPFPNLAMISVTQSVEDEEVPEGW